MITGTGNANSVGIFDSGLGGLTVWREVIRQLPHENTLYVADQVHVPYGHRQLDEVRAFARGITRFLLDRGAKVIVVACNTASAAALHSLRGAFPGVAFVGMEPAVKPATKSTRTGVVGVLATPATFQGELFASLMERYAGGVRVLSRVCPGLVEAVEDGELDTPETEALLRQCLSPLLAAGMDQLVLGCTHYPFLQPLMERIVGTGVTVIDPAPAVVRQVARVLNRRGMEAALTENARGVGEPAGQHRLYTSGDVMRLRKTVTRVLAPAADGVKVCSVQWHEGQLKLR